MAKPELTESIARMTRNDQPTHIIPERHDQRLIVTGKLLGVLALVFFSILMAVVLMFLPPKLQPILIFVIPVAMICLLILRWPFVGVYLYFLLLYLRPYDIIPALTPLRLTMITELVTLISWIIHLVRTRGHVRWAMFHWFYLGFIGVAGVATLFASNFSRSIGVWQDMVIFFVMFVMATNIANTFGRVKRLIWLLLVILGFHAVHGIYNFAFVAGLTTSGEVGSSFLADENDFALALNVMIPFAFFFFEHASTKLQRVFSGLLLVIFTLGVVSSFSRGGWVGLAVIVIYCVVLSKRRLATGAAVIFMVIAMIVFAPSGYWAEIDTITDLTESTANQRLDYWKAALKIYASHPFVGVGPRNAGVYLPDYMTNVVNPATQWGRAVHGTIPEVMADTGTLGLFCYLAMVFLIIRRLWGIRKGPSGEDERETFSTMATAMIGSMVGYLVTATFLSTAYYPHLWTLYTLAIMLIFLCDERLMLERGHAENRKEAARGGESTLQAS